MKERKTIVDFLNNIEAFETILQQTQEDLKELLVDTILPYFYNEEDIINNDGYICVNGETDIMLLAHMDTVFNSPPELIIYDEDKNIITSPQGLGGDDRCGIFSIVSLLKAGYRPFLLFTEDEEIGGVGASKAGKTLDIPESIKYLVQLDRRGKDDAVFYCCDNKDFKHFIEDYNFSISSGSFTDIDTLMPIWDICGVNLSIGYYNEHSKHEYVRINEMVETTLKVAKMIETLPEEKHEFTALKTGSVFNDEDYLKSVYGGAYSNLRSRLTDTKTCEICGEDYSSNIVHHIYNIDVCETCLQLLNTNELEGEVIHAI